MKARIITGEELRTLQDGYYWAKQHPEVDPEIVCVSTSFSFGKVNFLFGPYNEVDIPVDKDKDINLYDSLASKMQVIGPLYPPVEFTAKQGN